MTERILESEHVLPVRSRISWGAILAGAVVSLASYFLFSVFGTAIGLSIVQNVDAETLGVGAAIYAIVVTFLSLFIGGWITSRIAVGENTSEAAVYGVIHWGVLFAALLWLTASGVQMGFNAMIGIASQTGGALRVAQPTARGGEANVEGAGAEGVAVEKASLTKSAEAISAELRHAAGDRRTVQAAWWTFAGILLSIAASVAGALVGKGPEILLRRGSGAKRAAVVAS